MIGVPHIIMAARDSHAHSRGCGLHCTNMILVSLSNLADVKLIDHIIAVKCGVIVKGAVLYINPFYRECFFFTDSTWQVFLALIICNLCFF